MNIFKQKPKQLYSALLIGLIVALVCGIWVTERAEASLLTGILHADGVQPNGIYDEGPAPEIRFMMSKGISVGDMIELTFPAAFGDVDATSLELYQDTDSNPCDGTPVGFVSSVDPTGQVLRLTVSSAFADLTSVCVRNFDLVTPNPVNVLAISVKTKRGASEIINNFGAATHDGISSFGVVGTSGTVTPFLIFSLSGTSINMGQIEADTLFLSGPGYFNGGSTMTISSNASNGVTAFVQKLPFQNATGILIPDWGGGLGFGFFADSADPLVNIAPNYDVVGDPDTVPDEPSSSPFASVSGPGMNIEIDIGYILRVPVLQALGVYDTTLTIILAPDF